MNILNLRSYNSNFKSKFTKKGNSKNKESILVKNQCANWDKYDNNLANINKFTVCFTGIKNKTIDTKKEKRIDSIKGCLLGGAIGDAFGSPVEFMELDAIKKLYGINGVEDLELDNFGVAEFTDDTQMTIFTADGILKSLANKTKINELPDFNIIYRSYLDWFNTQRNYKVGISEDWILNLDSLYSERDPGITCLYSLQNKIPGDINHPINQSDGCGGLMRSAPVGLIYSQNAELAFKIGAETAALTHGSPEGYLPAGVLASIVSNIMQGDNIEDSINKTIDILKKYKYNETTLSYINKAIDLSKANISPEEAIADLGEGWSGHEAIAIAIYAVLKFPENYQKAIQVATNHDGDSDSTAAITGNIIGTYLGTKGIPKRWIESVELSKEIQELSEDLYQAGKNIEPIKNKYKLSE